MSNDFCADGFWNNSLFTNRKYPIFTECFQYGILLIPQGFFFVFFIIFLLFKMYKRQYIMRIPFDFWYILKLSLNVVLIVLLIVEIMMDKWIVKERSEFDGIFVLSYTLLSVTLILVMVHNEIRRRSMHPTCPILFTFWLTISVAYFFRFYSNIIRLVKLEGSKNRMIGILCVSVVIFILMTLSFINECISRYSPERLVFENENPCPEEYASILSKLTYFWLDKFIYRWYKKEMTEETTFNLRQEDKSTMNTNLVERYFTSRIKNIKTTNIKENIISIISSSTHLISKENKSSDENNLHSGWILFKSLFKAFGQDLAIAWIFKIVHDIFIYAMPFLLKILLQCITDKSTPIWISYLLAFGFLFCGISASLAENACFFITSSVSVKVRAALIGMIYRKTLRLNNEIRGKFTSGEIINLMGVDAERIMNWIVFSWFLLSCPLQFVLAILLLYQEMSYAIFAGLGVILAFFPLNGLLMAFMNKFSTTELIWKDNRIKTLTEILNGIKVLKMYAWENSFLARVSQLRKKEMKYILGVAASFGLVSIVWEILPFLIVLATFLTYIYMDTANILTAEKAFVSISIFNMLRFPMIVLPWCLAMSVNGFVSLKRIGEYLVGEELENRGQDHSDDYSPDDSTEAVIELNKGSFSWKKDDKVILNKINLEIHRGKLIAVVGKVGCGKSSLISALLGEMHQTTGSVKVKGKIAYVSQEAWIQNKSLKENILFTKNYEKEFYDNVIKACALTADIEQLPGGDETEIGERGINLSGGQKQRISLARAVYQNRDIYFLDDPLSAVDAHVGQHLFNKVISNKGLLKGKTRILVTHGLNWLPKVDEVFVLDSTGCISERGSFKELLRNGNEFMQFIQDYVDHCKPNRESSYESDVEDDIHVRKAKKLLKQVSESEEAVEEFTELVASSPPKFQDLSFTSFESEKSNRHRSPSFQKSTDRYIKPLKRLESSYSEKYIEKGVNAFKREYSKETQTDRDSLIKPVGQLIDEEEAMTGTVKFTTYLMYIKARGIRLFMMTIFIYIVYTAIQIFSNTWIEMFTTDKDIQNASSDKSINSSELIREKTRYYMTGYTLIGIGMMVTIGLYWIGYTIGSVKASKVIHKVLLRAILRSSMGFFDTTPSGRILNRFSKDTELMDHLVPINVSDAMNCFFFVFGSIVVIIYVTPWFAIVIVPLMIIYYFIQLFYMPTSRQSRRLDSIASSPVFNHFSETLQGVALIRAFKEQIYFQKLNQNLIDRSSKYKFIQFSSVRWLSLRIETLGNLMVFASVLFAIIARRNLNAGLIGLSISYSLQITEILNWLLRQYTDLETNAVALERIDEYSRVPSEAEWNLDVRPPDSWPNIGNVTFENYELRYRDGLPLVLKQINLNLKGGEKIGIVGRTGAGKSSLNLALFRLVEAAGGLIRIDGIDISTIGLHDLRKALTILPQDPVIFSGTLRENLDPFSVHSDEDLFESLETAHLKEWVSTLSEGMDYDCGEGGTNLSAGQKQLLCLARALLRKSKVLILDEATASVDVETDKLVMDTIRDYFRHSTVIIIAHRINTILDTDRIVVMENGEVIEMNTPQKLLTIPNGVFKSLYEQSLKDNL